MMLLYAPFSKFISVFSLRIISLLVFFFSINRNIIYMLQLIFFLIKAFKMMKSF